MIEQPQSAHRLGFMIPMILFVLFFVACCGTLVGLFVRSADISAQAGRMNDAVQLCRNQAERFRAGEDMAERVYFDANYQETAFQEADYYLNIQIVEEKQTVGVMEYADFTACTMDGESIYTLQAARYRPEGR